MTTIAAGNTAEIYVPLSCDMTFTPGAGGTMQLGFAVRSGSAAIAPQIISAATTVTVSAGATVFAQAINADATYTDPATTDAALQSLVSGAGNTLAIIGDSFCARWYNASGLTTDYQGKGFITWALAKHGGGMTVVSDTSIGQAQVSAAGSATTPLVTQIDTAAASGAKNLLMMGGLNDVVLGVSSDTIKAAWLEILGKAKAAGMHVWWCTQPGLGAGSTAYTAARQAQIFELNRWIKQQQNTSASLRAMTVIDLAAVVQDPASATGDWRAGYLNSTEANPRLHPAQPAAMAMGFEVARVWTEAGLFSPSILPTSNADNKAFNAASNILNSNGLFSTGSGTATGYTTSTSGAGAVTPTLASRADGFGQDQVLTGTWSTGTTDSFSLVTADLKANMVLGRWYRMVCEITTASSTNLRAVRVQLSATATASAISTWCQLDNDSDPDAAMVQELAAVVAHTKPFQYTAAMGTVSNLSGVVRAFGAAAAGGTTLKIGRLAIEEVAAP